MSIVDVEGFLDNLKQFYPDLITPIAACSSLLIRLDDALLLYNLGFGYRVIEEFVHYLAFVQGIGIMEMTDALDSQVAQKILVKLRGSERQRDLLEQLMRILQPYPKSLKIVEDLIQQLNEYGSFQYLR